MKQYEMNKAERELVEALRSGKYRQGVNLLQPRENEFCCLGVYCDLRKGDYGAVWSEPDEDSDGDFLGLYKVYHLGSEEHGEVLPAALAVELNWAEAGGLTRIPARRFPGAVYSLAELNDAGLTFSQIADIIEAGLVLHEGEDTTL